MPDGKGCVSGDTVQELDVRLSEADFKFRDRGSRKSVITLKKGGMVLVFRSIEMLAKYFGWQSWKVRQALQGERAQSGKTGAELMDI